MGLAITEDHRALADVARARLAGQRAAARERFDDQDDALPSCWGEVAALGWPGLAIPVEHGGEGAGLEELAVVLEEMGRAVAPGPFLPTVLAAAVLAEAGAADLRAALLPGLADGTRTAAVGLGGGVTHDGTRALGDAGWVLGGGLATVLLLLAGDDVVVVERPATTTPVAGLDRSRRGAAVTLDGQPLLGVLVGAAATARRLTRTLIAAEAAGVAAAALETSVAHVRQRTQFGRAVGGFQAVKHRAADVLLDVELAAAAAWDAARAAAGSAEAELAAAVAAARAVPGAVRAAQAAIQMHGAVGFCWEHDAHLYLRRAATLAAVAGQCGDAERDVARLTRAGVVRTPDLALPPESGTYRAQVRAFVDSLDGLDVPARRAALVDSGYLVPHWPAPWGRGASPTEQLVVERELGRGDGVAVPQLGITAWVARTIAQHGTPEQDQRWVRPALLGTTTWCQLFSEPGAGSDAAAVTTRGVRVDGGWRVSGQKTWTSRAQDSDWGFATVRTDPSGPKHAGITMMAIDMRAAGVGIRPLRQITGDALFAEVFLDDVLVPDGDVVGDVGAGWRIARATLGNERVSLGGGAAALPVCAADLLALADASPDPHTAERDVGTLVADDVAAGLLPLRRAARAVDGAQPGPEGALDKLFSSEHAQRVSELALRLAGPAAVADADGVVARAYLWARCLTIAGGTSEIARDQVAERMLGLPREPRPS